MKSELSILIAELETISADARENFGNLSSEQINWKPNADGWSVGQCFEHLVKTNALFFVELERISSGERANSFWENYSPLSGVFGNLIANTLKKDERKIKAPTPAIVPPGETDASVVEQFAAHQVELIERIKRCETSDWKKIKVTSVLMKLVTYSLADNFRILVEHERRHLRQAGRVMKAENFPASSR